MLERPPDLVRVSGCDIVQLSVQAKRGALLGHDVLHCYWPHHNVSHARRGAVQSDLFIHVTHVRNAPVHYGARMMDFNTKMTQGTAFAVGTIS